MSTASLVILFPAMVAVWVAIRRSASSQPIMGLPKRPGPLPVKQPVAVVLKPDVRRSPAAPLAVDFPLKEVVATHA